MKWTFLRPHVFNGRHHKAGDSADHLDKSDLEHLGGLNVVGEVRKAKPEPAKPDAKGGK